MKAVVVARAFRSDTYKCTLYMADVVGGPGALLARATAEAAVQAGELYFAEHYEPAPGGGWQTIRYSGPHRPGKDHL